MKLKKPDIASIKNLYNKGKKITQETLDKASEKAKPLFDDIAQEMRETAEKISDKAEPIIDNIKQGAMKATFVHKTEVLSREIADAQRDFLYAESTLNRIKTQPNPDFVRMNKLAKQMFESNNKVISATEKYNRFAAREAAAQEAFDRLNK